MNRILNIVIFLSALLSLVSCRDEEDYIYLSTADVAEERLAFLKEDVSQEQVVSLFPEADTRPFASASEMLLALSIGKYDACVVSASLAGEILAELEDYATLEYKYAECDTLSVLVHRSRIAGRNVDQWEEDGLVDRALESIEGSIFAGEYWKMILMGLLVTVGIFLSAWVLAMIIAIIMTLLSFVSGLKFLWRGLMLFIKTIHDVPSVVLIFFFYYVVFARADADAIYACIVALGVYSSGSFTAIITSNLQAVDPIQHKAAQMLGLVGWKKYRLVILPQAVRPMVPYLVSESKVLLRATTFAGYVSILDLVKVTELIRNQTYETLVPLIFVSIVFLLLSWGITEGLFYSYKKLFGHD